MASIKLISLNTVKSQLGITVSTGDTAITNMIAQVSADVRRILNEQYCDYLICTATIGSDQVYITPGYNSHGYYTPIPIGTVIQSIGFAEDTYIAGYNPITRYYTMSSNCISATEYMYPTININQWATISKMIWYKISKMTTVGIDKERGISSESYGPISISYSSADMNNKYNYPSALIDDLGTAFATVV